LAFFGKGEDCFTVKILERVGFRQKDPLEIYFGSCCFGGFFCYLFGGVVVYFFLILFIVF
jgi:hypothetical protein